jgi:hypothetical protein
MAVRTDQLVFSVLLVVILVGMAAIFVWRQWLTLRTLGTAQDLSPEDRSYTRNAAWRRIIISILLLALAGLLVSALTLEPPTNELVKQGEEAKSRNERPPLNDEQQQVWNRFNVHWLITLVVLLIVIALAGVDLFAIRRYGLRNFRKIQADRRTMIENQLARLRSQRNGHG